MPQFIHAIIEKIRYINITKSISSGIGSLESAMTRHTDEIGIAQVKLKVQQIRLEDIDDHLNTIERTIDKFVTEKKEASDEEVGSLIRRKKSLLISRNKIVNECANYKKHIATLQKYETYLKNEIDTLHFKKNDVSRTYEMKQLSEDHLKVRELVETIKTNRVDNLRIEDWQDENRKNETEIEVLYSDRDGVSEDEIQQELERLKNLRE